MVLLQVFGHALLELVEEPELELEWHNATNVKELIEANLEKVQGLLPLLQNGEILVAVNKKVAAIDTPVRDGDTVKFTHNVDVKVDGIMWQNP